MGNMDSISNFSNAISVNLSDSRQKITKLSSVHNLLTKLQTLFELPTLLRKAIQMEAYPQVSGNEGDEIRISRFTCSRFLCSSEFYSFLKSLVQFCATRCLSQTSKCILISTLTFRQ